MKMTGTSWGELSHEYWIEKNILVIRYLGITNGLFPIQDVRL